MQDSGNIAKIISFHRYYICHEKGKAIKGAVNHYCIAEEVETNFMYLMHTSCVLRGVLLSDPGHWAAPLLHSVKKFKLTFQIVQWTFKSEIMEVGSDDKVKAAYDGESTIYRTPVSTQHTHLTSL